ncbi:hypothetical protein EDB86DRAFT_605420 [Lactarius hatsudake]|nr:hypothetical protein EDB86DRAFT_605420 [Lactarius hatsudake]
MRSMLHTCRPILLSLRRKKVQESTTLRCSRARMASSFRPDAWLLARYAGDALCREPRDDGAGGTQGEVEGKWLGSCSTRSNLCREECPGTPEAPPPHDLNASLPLHRVARISQHGDDTRSSVNKNNRGGQYNTVILPRKCYHCHRCPHRWAARFRVAAAGSLSPSSS